MDIQTADQPPTRITLRDSRDVLLLGVTLSAWLFVAVYVDMTCHEGAHAVVAALLGQPVYGIYLSPVEGYVFSLGGGIGQPWVQSLSTAAGIPAGILLGAAAALALRWGMGRYRVGTSAFLLWLAILGLTQESSYLAFGWLRQMVSGGDLQYLIRTFGVHPLWFAIPGTVLLLAGGVASVLLLRRWLATYVPGMTKRQSCAVAGMVGLFLVLTGMIGSELQRPGRWV